MAKIFTKSILLCAFIVHAFVGFAQVPQLVLPIDSIRIGEQVEVILKLTFPKEDSIKIVWPELDAQFDEDIEVIDSTGVTNLSTASNKSVFITQQKKFTVTAWDSGYYSIEPFTFVIRGDSIATGAQHLYVNTVQVNLEEMIKPIKGIYEEPFDWKAFFKKAWPYVFGLLALAGLLILLYKYIERREIVVKEEKIPLEPAHVIALRSMASLKGKDLLSNGKEKAYQSELTEILRTYLEHRFDIPAMEQTTGETVSSLKYSSLSTQSLENLSKVLNMADEVKFAKGKLGQQLNKDAFTKVMAFVEETKIIEKEEIPESNE